MGSDASSSSPGDRAGLSVGHRAGLAASEALGRLELLATVSRALAGAIDDYRPAVEVVAEACVPFFADLCAVEVVGQGGTVEAVAYRVAAASALTAPSAWTPVGRRLGIGSRALLAYRDPGESLRARRLRARLGADSLIVAPISAGGIALGWFVAAVGPQRRGFRRSALRLAEDLANRLAGAISRVSAYQEAVGRAQAQARTADRLKRLAAAATGIARADSLQEVLDVAAADACRIFEAQGAMVRWRLAGGSEVAARSGSVPRSARAATAVRNAAAVSSTAAGRNGRRWVVQPLALSGQGQLGVVAVAAGGELSSDDQMVLSSLCSLISVAGQRALANEATRAQEARLRAVIDASPVALVGLRPEGTVTWANPAAAALFGWASGNGQAPRQLPELLRPAMVELAVEVDQTGSVVTKAVAAPGFDLSVSAAPMPEAAGVEPAVLVGASDLREQRAVERALQHAQRLETMGQVAGGVAHDFNNVLTVIIGYVKLLEQVTDRPDGLHLVRNIEAAAGRASALTAQLLGLSRRQLDRTAVVDLVEVVRGLRGVLSRLGGPGVTLHLRLPRHPVRVRADPTECEQITLNLAVNACDAMAGRGELTISVSAAELDAGSAAPLGLVPGSYAHLGMVDSGAGMSEEVRARCLEPFFTTKERGKGSGLGLSMVDALAHERHGALTIDSAPGRGTSISVFLPRTDARGTPPRDIDPGGARGLPLAQGSKR
jgi:PAS domain S-box-containing protein